MTSKSPLDGLLIGLADGARLIGKSETHVLSLQKAGLLRKVGRGQYRPEDVARAALSFRENEDRRSSQTEEQKRVYAARAREIELRIAREEGRLIDLEDVQIAIAEIVSAFSAELAGIPAACTRDLELRRTIEKNLNGAIDRCRKRFEEAKNTGFNQEPSEDGSR